MNKRKKTRTKGKVKLSSAFQELNKGDCVAVVRELARKANFPSRMQGKTGVVEGSRGRAYIVKIKDYKKDKTFIIKPVHLKKIK